MKPIHIKNTRFFTSSTQKKYLHLLALIGFIFLPFLSACQNASMLSSDMLGLQGNSASNQNYDVGDDLGIPANIDPKISQDQINQTNAHETFTPINIPVTIAKLINGVDPTSIQFTKSTNDETEFFDLTDLENSIDDETEVGIISGDLISSTGQVLVILDGEVIDELDASDGHFEYRIKQKYLSKPLAFSVLGKNGTLKNGPVSKPLVITVIPDKLLFGYRLVVQITNSIIDDKATSNIQNSQLSISHDSGITFSALDLDNTPFIGSVDIFGNTSFLISYTNSLWQNLHYDFKGNLYGINQNNLVKQLNPSNLFISNMGISQNAPANQKFRFHASQKYMAIKSNAINPNTLQDTLTVALINPDIPSELITLPIPDNEFEPVLNISFEWINSSSIVIFKEFKDKFTAEGFDVSKLLGKVSTKLDSPIFRFSSTSFIFNPFTNYGVTSFIYYECEDSQKIINICFYDIDSNLNGTFIDIGRSITNSRFSNDASYILFEGVVDSDENIIALYDFVDDEIKYLNRGLFSTIHPDDDSIISYLSPDQTGTLQVSIYNLDYSDISPAELYITPTEKNLTLNSNYTFTASGGVPPYLYSVVSGPGTIQKYTGLFKSKDQIGTSIIRVTDNLGDYKEASIVIEKDIINREIAKTDFPTDTTSSKSSNKYDSIITAPLVEPDTIVATAIQPDGKIVKTGYLSSDFGKQYILRYNKDLSLDLSFGTGGIAVVDLKGDSETYPNDVAIQNDGKIIVVGQFQSKLKTFDVSLIRLNTNGALDNTFGQNGIVITDLGSDDDHGITLAIQSDKKIIVAGITGSIAQGVDFFATRYEPNGMLDKNFAIAGLAKIDFFGLDDFLTSITLQNNKKIILTGMVTDGSGFRLGTARLNPDGTLDTTYDDDGKMVVGVVAGNSATVSSGAGENNVSVTTTQIKIDQGFNFSRLRQ